MKRSLGFPIAINNGRGSRERYYVVQAGPNTSSAKKFLSNAECADLIPKLTVVNPSTIPWS